jgi:cobalt/nickel transport system ATP-binding protein
MSQLLSTAKGITLKVPQPIALSLEQVAFSYPDHHAVLRDISLTIQEGERVGLIGHNGCGKTTLFMLLCGMLAPTVGTIHLFDTPVKPGQFYPEVGFLFQDPEDQLFSPSVQDDIAFGPQNLGLSVAEVNERVAVAMEMTGITALASARPTISLGVKNKWWRSPVYWPCAPEFCSVMNPPPVWICGSDGG